MLIDSPDPRVLILSGYGVSLTVNRGHVIARDGEAGEKRERKLARIDAKTSDGLARIIILSETGYISLDVLSWARALRIAVIQVDRNGDILMMSPGQTGDSRIRRAQVLAAPGGPHDNTGAEIVRDLLAAKLTGQMENLRAWGDMSGEIELARYRDNLAGCPDADSLIAVEGRAASVYWLAWRDRVFLPVIPDEMKLLPVHWLSFPGRSGITTAANGYKPSNRNATDPINAMINYGYQVVFTEAMYACHVMGLDPYFGLGHGIGNDKPGMALDLMEPLRPIADRIILGMLDSGRGIPYGHDGKPAYISADCFYEASDGRCRLYPPLTHEIVRHVSMAVALEAARHAEKIARKLANITGAANLLQRMQPVTADIRLHPRRTLKNSTRVNSLHSDLTAADMIPDALWSIVEPLIPPEPESRSHKPNPRSDNRAVLAGIIAHEIYGASWSQIPLGLGIDRKTCRRRLDEWIRLDAWPKLREVITQSGVSRTLSGHSETLSGHSETFTCAGITPYSGCKPLTCGFTGRGEVWPGIRP